MLKDLREKKISARELLDTHLERVRTLNPAINAVIALDEEGARAQAQRADEAIARGEAVGPLHGLPMTIKDVYQVVGMPVTGGMPHLAVYLPDRDADLVTSLRDAGAIIFGKTNVPEGAGDHQSYNALHGRTNNPWNVERTPGGSSGGSGAALAAGMTPLEIGSDVGGSIRCPAHFCGVYGHKPSFGIVPLRGHIPPEPGSLLRGEMAVAGPMARDPHDLELALDIIARPEEAARKGVVWRLPGSRRERLEDFRVGVWLDAKGYPVDRGYLDAIEGLLDDLRRVGVDVRRAHPDIDPEDSEATYFMMLFAEFGASAPKHLYDLHKSARQARGADNGPYGEWIAQATGQDLRTWMQHLENRERLRLKWASYFADYDILICPVMSTAAFPHDTAGVDHVAQLARTILV
ncbi:amidase family protein, partial [Rhizobiaceae sp. 2RAB30]